MTITEMEALARDRFFARVEAHETLRRDPAMYVRSGRFIWPTDAGKAAIERIHQTMPTSEVDCGNVTVRAISPKNLTVIRRDHIRFQYRVDGKPAKREAAIAALTAGQP